MMSISTMNILKMISGDRWKHRENITFCKQIGSHVLTYSKCHTIKVMRNSKYIGNGDWYLRHYYCYETGCNLFISIGMFKFDLVPGSYTSRRRISWKGRKISILLKSKARYVWTFHCHIFTWLWPFLKAKVNIVRVSTENGHYSSDIFKIVRTIFKKMVYSLLFNRARITSVSLAIFEPVILGQLAKKCINWI